MRTTAKPNGNFTTFGSTFTLKTCCIPSALSGSQQCRAIQLADLIAYYSRRDGVALPESPKRLATEQEIDTMIKILCEKIST